MEVKFFPTSVTIMLSMRESVPQLGGRFTNSYVSQEIPGSGCLSNPSFFFTLIGANEGTLIDANLVTLINANAGTLMCLHRPACRTGCTTDD